MGGVVIANSKHCPSRNNWKFWKLYIEDIFHDDDDKEDGDDDDGDGECVHVSPTEPHCRPDGPIVRFDFNQFHFISDHDDAGDQDDHDVFMLIRWFKLWILLCDHKQSFPEKCW